MATRRRPRIGGIVLVFRAIPVESDANGGIKRQSLESFYKERLECTK